MNFCKIYCPFWGRIFYRIYCPSLGRIFCKIYCPSLGRIFCNNYCPFKINQSCADIKLWSFNYRCCVAVFNFRQIQLSNYAYKPAYWSHDHKMNEYERKASVLPRTLESSEGSNGVPELKLMQKFLPRKLVVKILIWFGFAVKFYPRKIIHT